MSKRATLARLQTVRTRVRDVAAARAADAARVVVEAQHMVSAAEGAFAARTGEASYFAVCDERINDAEQIKRGRVNLAFGFAASKPGEYHAFIVTHEPGSSRARPITVNRFANYSPSVNLEIESSILRGLVPQPPANGAADDDTVRMPARQLEDTASLPQAPLTADAGTHD